jgi:hypothetical protein
MTRRFWGAVPLWVVALHLPHREARALIAITSHAGKPRSIEPRPDGVIEKRIGQVGTMRSVIAMPASFQGPFQFRCGRPVMTRGNGTGPQAGNGHTGGATQPPFSGDPIRGPR